MAGFDAEFTFDPLDFDLLNGLRAIARRRARVTSVRFHSMLEREGRGYFQFDGNGYQMNILLERLGRDLPTAAEAMPTHRSPAGRRRLANGLVDILIRHRLMLYDRYPESHVPRLRGRSTVFGSGVFELIPGKADILWPRLWVTDDVLASWLMQEVPAEVVVEEIHTAAEVLLRTFGMRQASLFRGVGRVRPKAPPSRHPRVPDSDGAQPSRTRH